VYYLTGNRGQTGATADPVAEVVDAESYQDFESNLMLVRVQSGLPVGDNPCPHHKKTTRCEWFFCYQDFTNYL